MTRSTTRTLRDWAPFLIFPIIAGVGAAAIGQHLETRNENGRPSQGARNSALRNHSSRRADEADSVSRADDSTEEIRSHHDDEADSDDPTGEAHSQAGSASGTDDPTVGTRARRYAYTALEGDSRIRVIRLHPATDREAPLRCSLLEVDLHSCDQLNIEAISYWWGPMKPKKKLHFSNETYLTIRPNLHAALKRFRRRTEDRFLWADAVCINQKNEREKSTQVRHMADIYRLAHRTLIWLGESDSGANCLDFFNKLDAPSLGYLNLERIVSETVRNYFGDKGYEPLTQFFNDRKWFMRRWIIQEVAESYDAVIYCSSSRTPWETFAAGVNILINHPPRDAHTSDMDVKVLETIQNIDVLWNIRDQPFGILDLLTVFHLSRCDWPRDRIFALLNLTDAKTQPNYSKKRKEEDIFISFAQDCLKLGDHLDLLHCSPAFQPQGASARESWPSWIPDWRQKTAFNPLLNLGDFSASGDLEQQVELHSDRLNLLVTGSIFDDRSIRITPILSPIPDNLERVHDWIEGWMPDFDIWPGKIRWRDFATTLVAGLSHDLSLKSRQDSLALEYDEVEKVRRMEEHLLGFSMLSQFAEKMNRLLPRSERPPVLRKVRYPSAARKYAHLVRTMMKGRCFFQGGGRDNAYMGVGPANMEKADIIVIFHGARTPFIVRQSPGVKGFRLIGDCYIHGIMHGEASRMALRERTFLLI